MDREFVEWGERGKGGTDLQIYQKEQQGTEVST